MTLCPVHMVSGNFGKSETPIIRKSVREVGTEYNLV